MRTEDVTFYSEGDELSAYLRFPDEGDPKGAIVQGPGFLGIKDYDRYRRYHERFTDAGFAALIFDYRGLGESEGEALLYPERQVEDFRNAITYLQTRDELDPDRIGVFGLGGAGGGHAVTVAGLDDRVKASVSMTCIADGAEWLRGMRREYEWLELLDALEEDRRQRVLTGESQLVNARGEDGMHVPTPERQRNHAEKVETVDPKVPTQFPMRCAEKVMEYRPEAYVEDISPRAIMFVVVEGDDTTPEGPAIRMYEQAGAPKKLLLQTGTTHYQSYDTYFDEVTAAMVDWYDRHLTGTDEGVVVREELA